MSENRPRAHSLRLWDPWEPPAYLDIGIKRWARIRASERGLTILAPVTYKNSAETETDESTEARVLRGFRTVSVFDVAQTDGKPLPEVAQRLSGDDPVSAFRRLQVVAGNLEYSVSIEPLPGTRNGDCNFEEKRIRVRNEIEPAQQVKTLAHELAHALLHNPDRVAEQPLDRNFAELEAESVAYVICQELGIDSGEYSFGYIAYWAGDGERAIKGIETSAARIQRAAHFVLTSLNGSEPQPPATPKASPPDLRDEITSVIPVGRGGMA